MKGLILLLLVNFATSKINRQQTQLVTNYDSFGAKVSLGKDVESCLLNQGFKVNQIVLRDRPETRGRYHYLNYQWNVYYETKYPLMYVLPVSSSQVREIVYCSRSHNIRAVPKCGGHSYAKYAYGDSKSLVIDLQDFSNISIDTSTNTADVDPGVLIGPLAWKLLSNNYTLPIGTCQSVGISTTLGGGYPRLARTFGMMVDYLSEVDIVTPSAGILTANNVTNKDLFWAVRGGGGGAAFGIVTRYKFQFPPPAVPYKIVSVFKYYKLQQVQQVWSGYMRLTASNPPNDITFGFEIHSTHIWVFLHEVIMETTLITPEMDKALPFFPPGAQNTSRMVEDYAEFLDLSGTTIFTQPKDSNNFWKVTRYFDRPTIHKVKAFITDKILGDSDIQILSEMAMKIPDSVFIDFLPLGGAISKFKPSDMAFVHRKPGSYKVSIHYTQLKVPSEGVCDGNVFSQLQFQSNEPICRPHPPDPAEKVNSLQFLHKFYEMTEELLQHQSAYQNDVDEELEDPLQRFFGPNLPRLMEIKKKIDPDNYFRNPQSVPPAPA